MRRLLLVSGILALLFTFAFAWARTTPLGRSVLALSLVFPEGEPVAKDSVRKPALYNAVVGGHIDSLYAVKHLRELYCYRHDTLIKIYRFALGDAPRGHKHFQGDEKTPEGLYFINDRNPNSVCHKNLGISYPNDQDRAYAKAHQLPTGGDIKIHGLPNGQGYIGKQHLLSDWTNGCLGVTDEEIDELYSHVVIGSPIYITP